MTARAFSEAANRSMHAQTTDEVWLLLLTFNAASEEPLYLANNNEDIVSRGRTYGRFPFEFDLPGDTGEGLEEARIVIDNVSRTIVDAIRAQGDTPTVSFEVVLASDPDVIEFSFEGMLLRDADWDAPSVRLSMRYENILSEPISELMTPTRFPGLF